MRQPIFLLLFLSFFFSPVASADEIFTKDKISFSIKTLPGFELRTLPGEDLVYLAIATPSPFIASVSVLMASDPKRAVLLKNPNMKAEYLVDPKNETMIDGGTLKIDGLNAYYYVASAKEFMSREGKVLFQIQKKIE